MVKKGDRLEIREDVPRRWLERVGAASEVNPINSARGSLQNGEAPIHVNLSHGNLRLPVDPSEVGPYRTGGGVSPRHQDKDTTGSDVTVST